MSYNAIIFLTFTETISYKFKYKCVQCDSNDRLDMLNLPIIVVKEL